jgi:hypothetical protein
MKADNLGCDVGHVGAARVRVTVYQFISINFTPGRPLGSGPEKILKPIPAGIPTQY